MKEDRRYRYVITLEARDWMNLDLDKEKLERFNNEYIHLDMKTIGRYEFEVPNELLDESELVEMYEGHDWDACDDDPKEVPNS